MTKDKETFRLTGVYGEPRLMIFREHERIHFDFFKKYEDLLEFIQKYLGLSKEEAEKTPVYIPYCDNKGYSNGCMRATFETPKEAYDFYMSQAEIKVIKL